MGHGVRATMTARSGPGVASSAPYDAFNLGLHVGDDPSVVMAHRQSLAQALGAQPVWLNQVHGGRVLRLSADDVARLDQPVADGALTTEPGVVCAVMVADCLPVLLAAPQARGVAALHAGWRGLGGAGALGGRGIVQSGVQALCDAASCDPVDLKAWLGPCIGPSAFEVGADVLQGFGVDPTGPHPRFLTQHKAGLLTGVDGVPRWWADLPGLARDALRVLGVRDIEGGTWCTVLERARFFSFRREGVTGRQAACIWLDAGV